MRLQLLGVLESDCSKNLVVHSAVEFETAGERFETAAHATGGESGRILGFRVSGSSLCMSRSVDVIACALVCLRCLVCLRLVPHLLLFLRFLLLLHMRPPHPCMLHTIRVRTRVRVKGPTGRSSTKGGGFRSGRRFACVLSQRWRQV